MTAMAYREHGEAMTNPMVAAVAAWLEHKRGCVVCKHVPRRWHTYCMDGNVLFERLREEEVKR